MDGSLRAFFVSVLAITWVTLLLLEAKMTEPCWCNCYEISQVCRGACFGDCQFLQVPQIPS